MLSTQARVAEKSESLIQERAGAGWLHLCNGLDPERDGGMVPSILGFTRALGEIGARVNVVTPTASRLDQLAVSEAVRLHGPARDLEAWVRRADLVHIHGLWQTQTRVGAAVARRARKPYLIAAHGMADPWALRLKAMKKRIYRFAVEDRNLKYASCLHALARSEVDALRKLAPKTPIALIPNGVDLAPFENLPSRDELLGDRMRSHERLNLLFFGRLHVKKGLDLLAEALRRITPDHPNWHLLLAGRDDGAREPFVRRMQEAGLADRVTDLGHVSGERARAVWAAADAFLLPSYSEGFSMSVLEALAARLPVVVTTACNFPELHARGAGIVVEPTASDVTLGMRRLFESTPRERSEMAARGRALVESDYTWGAQGRKLAAVYEWLLGGGTAPEVVQS